MKDLEKSKSILDSVQPEECSEPPTRILIKQAVAEEMAKFVDQLNPVGSSNYDDRFHKVSHYLSMLIDMTSRTDHRVHDEINEAVKKLKEMAYA